MRLAAIDIGTNSTRLLVGDWDNHEKKVDPLTTRLLTTRIGEGMGPEKLLQKEPMYRTLKCLAEYQKICFELQVDKVIAVATSAVRDAINNKTFIDLVKKELNWDIFILSGQEEALLSYQGAIKGLKINLPKPLVIDIGGGSTEFIWNAGRLEAFSVNAGAVRMTEGCHSKEEIYNTLKPILQKGKEYSPRSLIGVGGTLTTLAAIDQNLETYDPEVIHGYRLSKDRVNQILQRLSAMNLLDRRKLPGLQPERADIIVAGVLILTIILDSLNINEIYVSETDILYGIFYEKAG